MTEKSAEQLIREAIENMHPKEQMFAGRRFFSTLLRKRGVGAVIKFAEQAQQTLDKEGKLLDYDFVGYEDVLREAKPNMCNRRTFMRTAAFGIPGLCYFADGALEAMGKTYDAVSKRVGNPPNTRNPFAEAHEVIVKATKIPSNLLIGLGLVEEGLDKWVEIRFEEISNAVAEYVDFRIANPNAPQKGK